MLSDVRVVVRTDEGFGLWDPRRGFLLTAKYHDAKIIAPDRVAFLCANRRYLVAASDGTVLTEPIFRWVEEYQEGMAVVVTDSGWGAINRDGKMLVPDKFDKIRDFSEGVAPACIGATKLYIDGKHFIRVGGKWGFINRHGKWVIAPQYKDAKPFSEGLAAVAIGDTEDTTGSGIWGYINHHGKTVVPHQFEEAKRFSEGVAPVCFQGRWGYITSKGDFCIKPRFADAKPFSNGLAAVEVFPSHLFGFIDRSGKMIVSPQFVSVGQFNHGVAGAGDGKEGYIILHTGKVIRLRELLSETGSEPNR